MVAGLPNVSVHFGRFRVTEISLSEAALGQFEYAPMLEAASLLADARVQTICWNGTSASWLGLDKDRDLCAAIADRTGIAATSSVLALDEIFRLTGVERFGLVTPYLDEIQQKIIPNFRSEGFDCVAERHLNERVNFAFSETSAETLDRNGARGGTRKAASHHHPLHQSPGRAAGRAARTGDRDPDLRLGRDSGLELAAACRRKPAPNPGLGPAVARHRLNPACRLLKPNIKPPRGNPTMTTVRLQTAAASVTGRTRVRWKIFLMMLLLISINYIDRASLSVAMPLIGKEFEMDPAIQGLVLSAFFWTYALMQVPGGMLADRFKPRIVIACCDARVGALSGPRRGVHQLVLAAAHAPRPRRRGGADLPGWRQAERDMDDSPRAWPGRHLARWRGAARRGARLAHHRRADRRTRTPGGFPSSSPAWGPCLSGCGRIITSGITRESIPSANEAEIRYLEEAHAAEDAQSPAWSAAR